MDSIPHALHKLLLERAASRSLRTPPSSPKNDAPPPYTATASAESSPTTSACDVAIESDSPNNPAAESEEADPSALTLTIDAATTIRGSNNIVSTATSPLADATRLSAVLVSAIQALQALVDGDLALGIGEGCGLRVNLIVNAGITVIGDRNIIGNVPVRKVEAVNGAQTGLKRGADGGEGCGGVKRVRMER